MDNGKENGNYDGGCGHSKLDSHFAVDGCLVWCEQCTHKRGLGFRQGLGSRVTLNPKPWLSNLILRYLLS